MEEALSTEACMTSIVDNLSSLTDVSDSQSNYALNMFLVYLWKGLNPTALTGYEELSGGLKPTETEK